MSPSPVQTKRRALLIVNTHARRGAEAVQQVEEALVGAGLAVERQACAKRDDLAGLIRSRAADIDCVVIGGGDGTLNAAAPALLDTGLPLGIIPLGTANDLARTLNIPVNPIEAVAIIGAGHEKKIDIGLANDHPFFNVASIGFGVDLTRALTRDAKSRWGALGYAVAGFKVLSRMRPFRARIIQGDSRIMSKTIHLAIGNGRHYGGGMTVSEDAAIDDGRLNVYSLEVRSVWKLLVLLPSMRRGTHGRWHEVKTLSGQEIVVQTRRPRSVNTDGEITTKTPARFKVLPGAVTIYTPAP
ncbi:lipid kinase [Lichenifustis flavocetrariae]|uniref:Lipid kinase n=1 Tax=Lichenifustis flavocetrariae TaxID=2949735 RepID=A0AA42CM28_9HYPH|nr:lipid kinase [Lichenifustis flavocetrariae]MCW6507982.1 lipid kinase [Lichenifustis flavocetrariae]